MDVTEAPQRKIGAAGWIVLAIVALLVWVAFANGGGEQKAKAAAVDPAPCDRLISDMEQAGLVKGRPSPNRVDVEDLSWAALPADSKRALALAVRCSFLRGDIGRDDFNDFAVVYGYRSGKRLAMASHAGVTIE